MPPKEEFLPWVKLYQRRSLEELAGMYVDQGLGRTFVTPSVQAKADELTGKLTSDSAKVQAIFAFVKEHCTRPGGGDSAAQILAAKGGSKLTLMMALLDAAKVPFKYALAATSPDLDDSTDWDHPEPFQFHTALLKVLPHDGAPRWVYPDGPRYVTIDKLPQSFSGAPVIVCDGASGSLDVLPRTAMSDMGSATKLDYALQANGGVKAHYERVFVPMEANELKERVKTMPKKNVENFAGQAANQLFTGARLKAFDTPKLEDPTLPFSITIDIEAGEVVRKRADGQLTLATGLESTHLKQMYGGRSTRRFDLVLRGWNVSRDVVDIDLGPFACSRLPGDVQQESKYGQYSLIFVREGGKLRIERTLTLFPKRVTPAEYKDFLAFLDKVDAAEKRPLVVEPQVGAKLDLQEHGAVKEPSKKEPKSKPPKDEDDDDK